MNQLSMTRDELHTRGGILDRILDNLFDGAVLVDEYGKILYISNSFFQNLGIQKKILGRHISEWEYLLPFESILQTGITQHDLILEVHGRRLLANIYPIVDGPHILGSIGTFTIHDKGSPKESHTQLQSQDPAGTKSFLQPIQTTGGYTLEDYIGASPPVRDLLSNSRKAAESGENVLLLGESGTGKEIIASGIHAERHRASPAPYLTVHCTDIPGNLLESELFGQEYSGPIGSPAIQRGKLELAAQGSIFLDEIGSMDLMLQGRLLRALETRKFERTGGQSAIPLLAGLIASARQNLHTLGKHRLFRIDLYYRLSAFELHLPPLRTHPEDIPLLIDYFCEQKGMHLNFTENAIKYLQCYVWPGNIRQLKNLVNRWLVYYEGQQITSSHIENELLVGQQNYNEVFGTDEPFTIHRQSSTPGEPRTLDTQEWAAIKAALDYCGGNRAKAARYLGISRTALYQKLKRYKLQ